MWSSILRLIAPPARVETFDDAGDRDHLADKIAGPFRISSINTCGEHSTPDLPSLVRSVEQAMENPALFFAVPPMPEKASWTEASVRFPSRTSNGRDYVQADIVGRVNGHSAVVLVPHWNADGDAYKSMVRLLAQFGFTVFVVTLPYHRQRGKGPIANDFLNADLGCTINSVRQAVIEVRTLTQEIKAHGFKTVAYLGISLGSCVAALAAAFEPSVERVALLLTAGDFAETVWTGTATRHIRRSLAGHVSLAELEQAWRIISPSSFMTEIAARNLPTLVVLGEYDRVVEYRLGQGFVEALAGSLSNLRVFRLKCGHYSLAMFPFNILAFGLVARFLLVRPKAR